MSKAHRALTPSLLFCALALGSPTSYAQSLYRHCLEFTVSVGPVAVELVKDVKSPLADVERDISQRPPIEIANGSNQYRLVLHGPVLGSMDSPKVHARLTCGPEGPRLIATITRSADYEGATLQDVLWRPVIEVLIGSEARVGVFRSEWRMRLTNGTTLKDAATPPFTAQHFPIVVTESLNR